jgi:hypothetical protein
MSSTTVPKGLLTGNTVMASISFSVLLLIGILIIIAVSIPTPSSPVNPPIFQQLYAKNKDNRKLTAAEDTQKNIGAVVMYLAIALAVFTFITCSLSFALNANQSK